MPAKPTDRMLEVARAVVLQEQDVAAREQDIARRKRELEERQRELTTRRRKLEELRHHFATVAAGSAAEEGDDEVLPVTLPPHPPLARTKTTVGQRVLTVLEMEPRAFSALELLNLLELPPGVDTLRTTLWKMERRGLISRPFPGHYCANQHLGVILEAGKTG